MCGWTGLIEPLYVTPFNSTTRKDCSPNFDAFYLHSLVVFPNLMITMEEPPDWRRFFPKELCQRIAALFQMIKWSWPVLQSGREVWEKSPSKSPLKQIKQSADWDPNPCYLNPRVYLILYSEPTDCTPRGNVKQVSFIFPDFSAVWNTRRQRSTKFNPEDGNEACVSESRRLG